MSKRRLFCVGMAIALIGTVCLLWGMIYPRPGITLENFQRIRERMTLNEIEAILGKPGKEGSFVTDGRGISWEGENCKIGFLFMYILEKDENGEHKYVAYSGGLTTKDGREFSLRKENDKGSFLDKLNAWFSRK